MKLQSASIVAAITACTTLTMAQSSPAPSGAQAPPPTEIYLAPFTDGPTPTTRIGTAINITNNPGYDNQPYFLPDSSGLLFASNRDGKQTDIYRYDIATKKTTQLTHTPENEYSPTITPDHRTFTTVRGTEQRLWRFNLDGSDAGLAYAHRGLIGYHAWLSPTELAVYVLAIPPSQTNTLELIDLPAGAAEVVESNVGRSLHVRPGGGLTYVAKGASTIKELTLSPRKSATLVSTVPGSEDFDWSPRGVIVMGLKSKIYGWTESTGYGWVEAADLAKDDVTAITRLAISPDGKWIAIVSTPVGR
jgi:dipeptidyl aminopeptidase/acylaminoacyl peptidase